MHCSFKPDPNPNQALHEAGLAGQASKVDGLLGAGWLDISIDSYSKEAAEDTQAKRNELGQFIRTLGNIKVGIQSVACMEEMGMTVDDHDIAAFRFYSSMESFEEACKAKDLHPGLHRDRIALINMRELVETTEVDKTTSSSKVAKMKEKAIRVEAANLHAAGEGDRSMLDELFSDRGSRASTSRASTSGPLTIGRASKAGGALERIGNLSPTKRRSTSDPKADGRNSVMGGRSPGGRSPGGRRSLERTKRMNITVFETKYSIVPEKVEHPTPPLPPYPYAYPYR